MRMLVLLLLCLVPSGAAADMLAPRFCIEPPHDRPCAVYPADQTEFRRTHDYMLMSPSVQTPFDTFAWQGFVALNWLKDGRRAWQDFTTKADLFGSDAPDCAVPEGAMAIDGLVQADGHPLIDRDGNFVVYDTRMNAVMAEYVLDNGLDSHAGQRAYEGEIDFPQGEIAGQAPSVMLKTAWRVFAAGTERDDHLTAPAVIRVPASMSLDGQPLCIAATVGLVGMHIVTRTSSGHGGQWIWTTFEHHANASYGRHARAANSIFAQDLFPEGCGDATDAQTFAHAAGLPNAPPELAYWATRAPHARRADGSPATPANLSRCWRTFDGTHAVNAVWRDRLAPDVLSQYRLVVAQWRGTLPGTLAGQGEVPRYASNLTMESFIQTNADASCLGCHATATDTTGRDANFTFLLGAAR